MERLRNHQVIDLEQIVEAKDLEIKVLRAQKIICEKECSELKDALAYCLMAGGIMREHPSFSNARALLARIDNELRTKLDAKS